MKKIERFYADVMAIHPEVTGSCNLVVVKLPNGETIKFVVDCGLFQEKEYSELNKSFPFDSQNIDFVLITHNHVDHTGRLPLMVKNGYRGEIYTTEDTSKLIPLALDDSYKVLRDTSKRRGTSPLYNDEDVDMTKKLIRSIPYSKEVLVNNHVKVTFFVNGHLIGAAMILVQIVDEKSSPINLLFTGDYNNKNFFFDVPDLPQWVLDLPLTIIQESTYGYMNSTCIKKVFKENILRCMERGGTAVVPIFSLGRGQEILYEVKLMQDSGELDADIPIYFDGKLGIRYTHLYLNGSLNIKEEMKEFLPKNLTFVDKLRRSEIVDDKNRKIILTTSGMGSYGPAQVYIPEYIQRKGDLIHFTGYTSEGTLGSKLKNAEFGDDVEVGGLIVKKLAEVDYTTEYSAHAKADEMIEFLQKFNNLELVLVNHGQDDVKVKFAKRILNEVETKYVGILGRDYFFRVDRYGLRKTLSTKFK